MSPQAQLVMVLWLPVLLYLFTKFPPRRAVILSFLIAWLFLPQRAGFALPGLPDYNRTSATCYGILIAIFIYDPERFKNFKFGWLDIPMLIWCLCPIITAFTNDPSTDTALLTGPMPPEAVIKNPAYDAVSYVLEQIVAYAIPYFIGRIYFNTLASLTELAIGILLGGIIYAPLCLFESVMSPQLHRLIYGYHGFEDFSQAMRLGGYRPTVFMSHGLSVGMWMMVAAFIALWLWQAGVIKEIRNIPMQTWVIGMLVMHLLVRSTGAYMYTVYGVIILFAAKTIKTALPLFILSGLLAGYLYLGVTGNFTGERADQIVQVASNAFGPDRAQSLEFRFDNEEGLVEKALKRQMWGWGGWGRNRVYAYQWDGTLKDVSVTDSLWIIAFGTYGVVGVASVFGTMLLPAVSFTLLRYPPRTWFQPHVASAAVLSVVIVLYALDNCLNNQYNPVFTLVSGGIVGLVLSDPVPQPMRRPPKQVSSSPTRTIPIRPRRKRLN